MAIAALALLSVCLSVYAIWRDKPLEWRFSEARPVASAGKPVFETVLDYTAPAGQAHAPAIVTGDDGFSVIWFQGSAEAQPDVDIFAVKFTPDGDDWRASDPARYVTRSGLGKVFEPKQLVVTLGNTIQNEAAEGHLYSTAVSVGGWAMASVADVTMGKEGPVWARKLNLSPLLNRSHLVKSPMIKYADGSHALPAYFEMGPTFAELVRLGPNGRVRDVRRMPSKGVKAIQPMIVPLDEHRAVAFLRDFDRSGKLWISHTSDGGQSWSPVTATDMRNPSAPVAALHLGGERIMMVANDDPEGSDALRLLLSGDGGASWHPFRDLEPGSAGARYPMLRRLDTGEIVLTYSHGQKRGVRAHVFNDAWLEVA
ncbi:hypothetical protein PEL8287_01375 [Roseovarius litorisediminis]|uniref:Sialidase domain-containing protein n=1 Tax=Roseovarius litorisediminis TaxID=1312363 RepID=A0A1Y5S4U7_9RHOB|nr:hypothetical protein PEL8287_01375 [Roseovarius litorisediminis]